MTERISILFLCILALTFSRCGNHEKSEDVKTAPAGSANCVKPLNPNGDSELAVLMRVMYDSAASLKTLVSEGKVPGKIPEIFFNIHKAIPTDSTVSGEVFDGFATAYLEGLKTMYRSSPGEAKKNYNFLLNKCVDCHQHFCPGPIKAINKLRVAE